MAQLAAITRRMGYQLEQVQDFTPTPMTVATEMFYTGYDPYTLEPVFTAHTPEEKQAQRQYFFWYKDNAKPQKPQRSQKPHSSHENNRADRRPEESRKEKRGRNRRHP